MKKSDYQILLYYKYVRLKNPEDVMEQQRALCEKLSLKGRILLAEEGINGTLEGTIENTQKYIKHMNEIKEFKGITYKKSEGTGDAFRKLSVKVRSEIVTSNVTTDPTKTTGKYITSVELHKWYEEGREFYIVDMRNEYEYASGYFENFVPSGMNNFFDLSEIAERLSHLKGKTIVTVCTGGIRCEKASGFLIESGFADVYQLKDGIYTYMKMYPNQHFKGKLYVFDKRMLMGFNTDSAAHEVVGKCDHCGHKSENYVNCQYNFCSRHHIQCEGCYDKELNLPFCDKKCKKNYLKILKDKEVKLHSVKNSVAFKQ